MHFVPLLTAFALAATQETPASERLLIVAPAAWCEAFEPFAAHKRTLPWIRSCTVISVESLSAEAKEGDEAERLKRGMWKRWQRDGDDGVDAVLLVGDMHVLPTRYMMLDRSTKAACDVAFYASDLYYADLADDAGAFENWNARTDGIHARYIGEVHGESGKDGPIDADGSGLVPEIALGRFPAATVEEACALAAKTKAHDARVLAGRRGGHDGAVTPSAAVEVVACGAWIDNAARIRGVSDALRTGFTVSLLSYFDTDTARHPNPQRVVDAMNSGRSLILHTGHGEPHGWQDGLRLEDLEHTRHEPTTPVILSIGCSTAVVAPQPPYEAYRDADGTDHLGTNAGEVFLAPPPPPACLQPRAFSHASIGATSVRMSEGGAIAYIGCVTGSQPCAHTLLDAFAECLAREPAQSVGGAWSHALKQYIQREHLRDLAPSESWYPPSIYFQPMKFVLLGDPTARLR